MKKVKGKHLLIKFIFDSHNDGGDDGFVCNTLDKYLSLDVWMRLYEKLGKTIERYVKHETKVPSKETISMHRAQMELHISWKKIDAMHSGLCELPSDNIYPYFMVVDVRAVSRVSEFLKKCSKSKALVNGQVDSMENDKSLHSTTSNRSGINDVVNGVKINATTSKQPHEEEYVPEASTPLPKQTNLSYTPSKNVEASEMEIDEYTPTKMIVVNANASVTERDGIGNGEYYYPSTINNNNYNDHTDTKPYSSRGQIKSPRPNKIRATMTKTATSESTAHKRQQTTDAVPSDKAHLNQQLFGDSSGSDVDTIDKTPPTVSSRSHHERKAKLFAQKSIGSMGQSKQSTSSAKVSTSADSSHTNKMKKEKIESPKRSVDEKEREEINKIIRQKIEKNTLTDLSGNQLGLTRIM